MNRTIDLSGLRLLNMPGVYGVELKGRYSKRSLTDLFIQEWIPYYECHKCGRFDYCKHVVRIPGAPQLSQDIKCGIFKEALEVFVETTFNLLSSMGKVELQQYLDIAFHYGRFIFMAELWVGDRRSKQFFRAMGTVAPKVMGNLFFIRERLDSLATAMSKLQCFDSRDAVLFVEGWSEKTFLEKLGESGLVPFCYLTPQVYDGRGNCTQKRITMLLQKYVERGYKVFMQGDADGRDAEIFGPLINKGLVSKECTFVFKHDFESSIPSDLAYHALRSLGHLNGVRANTFIQKMTSTGTSFAKLLSENFQLDVQPFKKNMAAEVGTLLNARRDWFQDKEFMASELGKFLTFIQWVH